MPIDDVPKTEETGIVDAEIIEPPAASSSASSAATNTDASATAVGDIKSDGSVPKPTSTDPNDVAASVTVAAPVDPTAAPAAVPTAVPPTPPPSRPPVPTIPLSTQLKQFLFSYFGPPIIFDEKVSRGSEPRPEQLHSLYLFGATLIALGIISMVPAFADVVEHVRVRKSSGLAVWAYLVFFLGLMKLAYGIYSLQMPDWSTAWVATMATLLIAMFYATVFGALLMGKEHSPFVVFLEVQQRLSDARLWTLCILCLTSLVAYFGGRMSARWRYVFHEDTRVLGK